MDGPVNAHLHPTALERFASDHDIAWFPPSLSTQCQICTQVRCGYPGYLQRAALFTAHPARQSAIAMRFWLSAMHLSTEPLVQARCALDECSPALDMPEDYFLDTIRVIFHDSSLARESWRINAREVRPAALAETPQGRRSGLHNDRARCRTVPASHHLLRRSNSNEGFHSRADARAYLSFGGAQQRALRRRSRRRF